MKGSRLLIIIALAVVLSIHVFTFPAELCLAAANISLDQYISPVGASVTVTGAGFSSQVAVSTITFSSGSSTTSAPLIQVANNGGDFVAYFTVPTLPKNRYTVTFISSISSNATDTAIAPCLFTIIPAISLDSNAGQIGSQVIVNGNGFAAGPAKVSVSLDNSPISLGSATASATGTFSGLKLIIPDATAGSHNINVTDSAGNAATATYVVRPKITVSPVSVAPGTQITVAGKGFMPVSPLNFTFDGVKAAIGAVTNDTGSFSGYVFTVPTIAGGSHNLKVTDSAGNFDTSAVITTQSMTISPKSGQVDSLITITGTGFGAGKNITVTFKGQAIPTVPKIVVSDDSGNFNAVITVPPSTAGVYAVGISDAISSCFANFNLTTTIKMDQTSGGAGSIIPISGNGFTGGAEINIKYDGYPIASGKVDAAGVFSTSFKVPAGPAGQHKIIVSDGVIPVALSFTSIASAQISDGGASGSQITGNVGSQVTVSGSAFVPGASVAVTFDTATVASTTVKNDGSFSISFNVPVSKSGKHAVTASDGTNSISNVFMMDSTPPAAANLTLPLDDSRMNDLPKFQWSPVRDPSGVIYTLQIAQDSGFSSILLQKTGLTANSYQLANSEKLKSTSQQNPYYWRVMAVNGASVEGLWSKASTFYVGSFASSVIQFMSNWVQYVIYAVVGLTIFVGGFFLGSLFEFDASQFSRISFISGVGAFVSGIGDFFNRITGFISGLFNFGLLRKILKRE